MKVDPILLKKIHETIDNGSTGSPGQFAEKLGISKRSFHDLRGYMINYLHFPIDYCSIRKTYYYTKEFDFFIGDLSVIKTKLKTEIINAIIKQ